MRSSAPRCTFRPYRIPRTSTPAWRSGSLPSARTGRSRRAPGGWRRRLRRCPRAFGRRSAFASPAGLPILAGGGKMRMVEFRAKPVRDGTEREDPFPELDGSSPEIRRLKQHMLRVAQDADITVLILGESGTGKERVARAIHRASPRRGAPFVVVNCA